MIRTSVKRRAAAAVAAAVLPVSMGIAAATPAEASSMWFSKSSGRLASADWLEVGELPGGVPGNIHFGSLFVEERSSGNADIWGYVDDLTCPEGVIPDGPGGGHDEPEPGEEECTYEGSRFIENDSAVFSMDRKFNQATLIGTLAVFGHDGPTGNPAVNMTWTGVGDAYKSTESGRFTDGNFTYSYRYSFSGRSAQVSGNIGAMVFDDEDGEWSFAQMGSYRSADRGREK